MRRYLLCAVNVCIALAALDACSTLPCSSSTCVGGCCDATGVCVAQTSLTCGVAGSACKACVAGEVCASGLCVASGGGAGGGGDENNLPARCAPTAVTCQDESIMQLPLFDTVNPDGIVEEGTAPDFISKIDARAGGLSPMKSFVYAKFTRQGLLKKDLSDEASLASTDWDFALRRYVLRLNSGVSGPSCAEGARTAPGTMYDGLTKAPKNLGWRTEIYFGATCVFVPDSSGIGAPGTALSGFWKYMMCVQMTGNVYVLHLKDDRYVKLQVLSYYSPSEQTTCDMTGSVPMPNSAALVRIRWAFIDAPDP